MELQDHRRDHRAGGQRGLSCLVALILLSSGLRGQSPDERVAAGLERVEAADEGEEVPVPELADAYRQVVQGALRDSSALPADFDLVDWITTFRDTHSDRFATGELERIDWQDLSDRLGPNGRHREALEFLDLVLSYVLDPSAYGALLYVDRAASHRALLDLEACREDLGRADRMLDELGPSSGDRAQDEARFLIAYYTAAELHDRGLPDLAAPYLNVAIERGDRFRRDHENPALWNIAVLLRVRDDVVNDRGAETLRFLEKSGAIESVRAYERGRGLDPEISLRLWILKAIAEAEVARTSDGDYGDASASLERAANLLQLREPPWRLADRHRLFRWQIRIALEEGDHERARQVHASARALLDRFASDGESGGGTDVGADRWELDGLWLRLQMDTGGEVAGADRVRLEEDFESYLARWRVAAVPTSGQGLLHLSEAQGFVGEYLRWKWHADGPEAALGEVLRFQALGSMARSLGAPAGSVERVQAELATPTRGLLYFHPGRAQSLCFAIDAESVTVHEMKRVNDLDRARKQLVAAITSYSFEGSKPEARAALDQRLAEAAEAFLTPQLRARMEDWSELWIVGVDSIGYLPFEALAWDETTTLGQRFAVGYVASLPVGLFIQQRAGPPQARTAADCPGTIFVHVDRSGQDGGKKQGKKDAVPLTFTDADRRALILDGAPGPLTWRIEQDATLAALTSGDFRDQTFVQLIVHGAGDLSSPRPFGLQMFDGVLSPELADRMRPAPVMILNACQTWSGSQRRGDDGRGHLAGAFTLQGTHTLVMSHGEIDYRLTLALMRTFHSAIARGATPAEAMQQARRGFDLADFPELHRVQASLLHVVGLAHRPLVREP